MELHRRHTPRATPFRVLFLCTGNSARSQLAEALLQRKGRGDFEVGSAGSNPAAEVHPLTLAVLREHGVDWTGRTPEGMDEVQGQRWDFVITVCDRARESCPTFPGQPVYAHWGMPDPAAVAASPAAQVRAFQETLVYVSRRLDLLLALPIEKLERAVLEQRVRAIGGELPFEVPSTDSWSTRHAGVIVPDSY
jgi:protein-tyrosine-phosphatase